MEYDARQGGSISLSGLSGMFVGQGWELIDLQMHAQTLALAQFITQSSKGVRSFRLRPSNEALPILYTAL